MIPVSACCSWLCCRLKIQMRMYMGAGVVDPSSLIILHDIQGAGYVKGHGGSLATNSSEYIAPGTDDDDEYGSEGHDLVLMAKLQKTPWTDLLNDPLFVLLNLQGPYSDMIRQRLQYDASDDDSYPDFADISGNEDLGRGKMRDAELPLIPYCGTVINRDMKKVHKNNGHLESLDDPENADRLEGRQKCQSRSFTVGGAN